MSRRIHDSVARHYNSEDGIIAAKNRIVAERLVARWHGRTEPLRVVDLGVGDGALLGHLSALALPMHLTGVDVSPAMLEAARRRVRLAPVRARAEEADRHLAHGGFDLVLAHFILAYVRPRDLFPVARRLLAPGGVLSLVSTVLEGGQAYYDALDRHFRRTRHPGKRLIGWAADRALARSYMPADAAAIETGLREAGLTVEGRHTLRVPVRFASPREAYRFGIEEGWAVNILAVPWVPVRLAQGVALWGLEQCDYPFEVTTTIEVVEASLPSPPSERRA
jgi:SAM-dependent methyltransferase